MALASLCACGAADAYETPTMGWSSWNTYGFQISEDLIKAQTDAMVEKGLKDVGYTYINIDDGFFGGRDSEGHLLIHPTRFPNGMQPVVDYIAENKHPIIDFMDQMTIDMNWGITELFGGDGDAYIRNIRDNGYESLAGDFNAFDDVQGQNWQDWRIAQLYQRYAELIAAGKEAEAQALLDRLNSMNQDPSSMTPRGVEVKKPNIYLYPETKTEITVTFDRPELLTVSDPLYGDGWTVTAHPDGTLEDAGGKYGFLFYESLADPSIFRLDEGFVVKAEQREQTYRRVLEAYGFNEQEILDFIEYWTDYLEPGVDYVMYPLLTEGVDAEMPVRFSVQPDNIFRLWFGFVRYEGGAVPEPEIVPMDRSGFEAVEWGGAVLN